MNTEEFQDTNTDVINNEEDLTSHLQGYIKAITTLVRSVERANHHIKLLTTAIEKKKPPRGLTPLVNPRIPDTPAWFIIK